MDEEFQFRVKIRSRKHAMDKELERCEYNSLRNPFSIEQSMSFFNYFLKRLLDLKRLLCI